MALVMLGIAFGVLYLFESGLPIHPALVLMIGAFSFIIGSVFFDAKGASQLRSLIGGGVIAISSAFIITAIIGSIMYCIGGKLPGWEIMVSSLAVCMVASAVIIQLMIHELPIRSRPRS
ncbi:MAG: heat-shock protein [Methanosarcinales archaeon]|nr:MAG: heat-shock protein [Methanosarcinales archaeon]